MQQENTLIKQQVALVDDASRILSLRVEGLLENNGENLITYVASTLSRTGISCSIDDIDYVKRVGRHKQGTIRWVLVKFLRESKQNLILYNRANLNRNTNSLIWINDDVSDLTRRQRKTVHDIATYAKSICQTDLKVHGDGLVVGNGKYKHQDLDLLPPHLSIANAKQPSNESDLYFQSEYSPLSNFYLATIIDDSGVIYSSAEQCFQRKKALSHGYNQTAKKIMLNRDPYELKRLGNQVQVNQEWRDSEENTMTQILRSKFTQNPDLAEILVNTDQLHLHEASADQKWATGDELASKALQSGSWPGMDRLGCLLETIRAELQGQDPASPPTAPPQPNPTLVHNEGDDLSAMPDDDPNPPPANAPLLPHTPRPAPPLTTLLRSNPRPQPTLNQTPTQTLSLPLPTHPPPPPPLPAPHMKFPLSCNSPLTNPPHPAITPARSLDGSHTNLRSEVMASSNPLPSPLTTQFDNTLTTILAPLSILHEDQDTL